MEILLSGFCLEILALTVPLFTQVIFDKVIVHNSFSTLHVVSFGMLLVAIFEGILAYFYSRHIHYLSAQVDDFLTQPVITRLLQLPLRYFESRPKGEIATYVRDIAEIRQFLAAASVSAVIDAAFIVVILILLMFYSIPLALCVAVCIPILVLMSFLMRPSVLRNYKHLSDSQAKFESLVAEGLANISTIKTNALEAQWLRKWSGAHNNFVESALRAKSSAAFEDSFLRIIQRIIVLAVLWIGAGLVLDNSLSFGQLIACYMFGLRVLGPSGRIFQVWMGLQRMDEAKKHLEVLLSAEPEQLPSRATVPVPKHGSMVLENVSFRYSSASSEVLKNINIEIEEGSFVGVLGHSGCGKSTLAKLIQHHCSPNEGVVRIGDVDLRMMDITNIRQHIRLVTQDAALFQDTILGNLRSGVESISLESVISACKLVGAHNFIEAMPASYDTVLDEKGAQLSSGQKQRIALARAVLQSPHILILDEATNALDAATEQMVLRNLHREFENKVLIVITHRAQTIRDACQILVVEGAKVQSLKKPYPTDLSFAYAESNVTELVVVNE